jgi:hypothetical protein
VYWSMVVRPFYEVSLQKQLRAIKRWQLISFVKLINFIKILYINEFIFF